MSKKALSLALSAAILAIFPVLLVTSPRWVYGRVHDAETGEPLAGVQVTVGEQVAVSDGQGYFQLAGVRGLPVVKATIAAYHPASVPLAIANMIGTRREISLRLKPVELRGKVTDATTRRPIAGAIVRVAGRELQTDARGGYSVKRLVPGGTVSAQAQYYRPSDPVAYEGQPVQNFALVMLPATVTVRDEFSGELLAGASVKAAGKTYQSDARGQVVIPRLEPGTEVIGTLKGYKEGRTQVSPGDNAVLNLRPPILRGTVRNQAGQPLAGALVLLRRPGHEPRSTYTDAQGVYQLSGSSEEEGTLLVRLAGYRREERQLGPNANTDFDLQPHVAK
ncbi:MAG: carboxypeptidase regulatory-like domain-containing protein, partial [Anaerolineae bacterium]|nr:carboxypeptidase regulatory-like domain-containing protein [Anaerolineae bacterium]